MKYYVYIYNNIINGWGAAEVLDEGFINYEISSEIFNDLRSDSLQYIWNGKDLVPNPDYQLMRLTASKDIKYKEANAKAQSYLESGEALFEFTPDAHIEATDGNIGKFSAYALAYITGETPAGSKVEWTTKEDKTIELTQDDVTTILKGLGAVQADVWNNQFIHYINLINLASTKEEVETIEIMYPVTFGAQEEATKEPIATTTSKKVKKVTASE